MRTLEEMMNEFDDVVSPRRILKPPFAYTGGKMRSLEHILPHLPYRRAYIEPFGGSASVMLARQRSPIEIFNDRYAGVTSFYRCMRDEDKMIKMTKWLDLTVNSREEWQDCRNTWNDATDDVERAAKWYYMLEYSFNSLGRSWGKSTKSANSVSGKLINKLKLFPQIHERFRRITVENLDWFDCMVKYDAADAVFYVDPPYLGVHEGTYKYELTTSEHEQLLDAIFNRRGYVAVSGKANKLYDSRNWSNRIEYTIQRSVDGHGNRQQDEEVLWIYAGRT